MNFVQGIKTTNKFYILIEFVFLDGGIILTKVFFNRLIKFDSDDHIVAI